MGVEWINHKGGKVLYTDYSEVKTQEEMLEILRRSAKIAKNCEGTILSLVDMTNAVAGPDFMKEAKEQGKSLMGKAEKSTVVGITGLKRILLKAYSVFSGSSMKPFDTKEEALDYLVS